MTGEKEDKRQTMTNVRVNYATRKTKTGEPRRVSRLVLPESILKMADLHGPGHVLVVEVVDDLDSDCKALLIRSATTKNRCEACDSTEDLHSDPVDPVYLCGACVKESQ